MMNAAAPALAADPEVSAAAFLAPFLFITLGLLLAIFPRKLNDFQIWMTERQLRSLRSGRWIIFYRIFGILFAVAGLALLIVFIRALR